MSQKCDLNFPCPQEEAENSPVKLKTKDNADSAGEVCTVLERMGG